MRVFISLSLSLPVCMQLNGLLDGFAAYEVKKKNDQQQQRGDWLALVQLLLRSETARLRTATRIIQVRLCNCVTCLTLCLYACLIR